MAEVVTGDLNTFTDVQNEKFEIQTIAQVVADITAIVGKVPNNISLKWRELIKSSFKPEFRFCVQRIMNVQNYCLGTI